MLEVVKGTEDKRDKGRGRWWAEMPKEKVASRLASFPTNQLSH